MTYLQQINNTLKEYIKIPLSIFYKSILAFTVILFIAIWVLTIPSFSKLASMIILEILFIFTGLLFYGNYKEEKISKDLEEYKKFESQIMKSNDLESEEYMQKAQRLLIYMQVGVDWQMALLKIPLLR